MSKVTLKGITAPAPESASETREKETTEQLATAHQIHLVYIVFWTDSRG